jgi:hypothetical protein
MYSRLTDANRTKVYCSLPRPAQFWGQVAGPSGRRRGRLIRTLDQFEIVRDFETRVRKGVGVVPLDPYVWSLPSALRRNTDDRPASLEQAMTPDHEVADAELSHTRLRLRE